MNWIFESYSSVYNTAMMQDRKSAPVAQAPKKQPSTSAIARLFGRG